MLARYFFMTRIAARRQWIYRRELFWRSVSMVLFMVVFIALWQTAYQVSGRDQLAGYSLAQVIWYLGMAETVMLSTSRIFVEISEAVKSGAVTYELARPLSYPLLQLANSLGNSAPRFLLNLMVALLVVLLGTGQLVGSVPGLLAFLLTAGLALLLDALFAVLIGLLAFWLEEVMPVYMIYQKLLFSIGGLFLPLEIFPAWLQRLASWLPFHLIAYTPARSYVAFEFGEVLRSLGGQLIYLILVSALLWFIWRRVQRRLVVHGG